MPRRSPSSKVRYRVSLYTDVPIEAEIHEYLNSIEDDLRLRGIELRRLLLAGYRALAAREGGLLAESDREHALLEEFHRPEEGEADIPLQSPTSSAPAADPAPVQDEPATLPSEPAPPAVATSEAPDRPVEATPPATEPQRESKLEDTPTGASESEPAGAESEQPKSGASSPSSDSLARMKAKMANRRKPAG